MKVKTSDQRQDVLKIATALGEEPNKLFGLERPEEKGA